MKVSSLSGSLGRHKVENQASGLCKGFSVESIGGVIRSVQKRRVHIEERQTRDPRLCKGHVIREKRTVGRLEFDAEERGGFLHRASEPWVTVRQIIQGGAADVIEKNGGPDIACVPVDAEHLGIKAAPEQAIAQVKLPKGGVSIEEKEFDVRG